MKYLNAFIMCQSMFCALPGPWKRWDEKARPYMLLFLPIVGLEIGIIWTALAWVMNYFALPAVLVAAGLCLYPFFITGFIHLDGFMDVTDAVRSYRDLDRRREILKDSRVGAFSVICCIALMIMQFAGFASITIDGSLAGISMYGLSDTRECGLAGMYSICAALTFIPVISRCCSALAVTMLPSMGTSQYAGRGKNKKHCAIILIVMALFAAAGAVVCGTYSLAMAGCVIGYTIALRRAYKSLEGMNGDISGYALTIGELFGVIVLALL